MLRKCRGFTLCYSWRSRHKAIAVCNFAAGPPASNAALSARDATVVGATYAKKNFVHSRRSQRVSGLLKSDGFNRGRDVRVPLVLVPTRRTGAYKAQATNNKIFNSPLPSVALSIRTCNVGPVARARRVMSYPEYMHAKVCRYRGQLHRTYISYELTNLRVCTSPTSRCFAAATGLFASIVLRCQ